MTFDVSKLDKSREVKFEQPENIYVISVTSDVSKLDKSREVKFEQPENIKDILVTFDVSKLDKSREVKLKQPRNIHDISVTFDVSKLDISIILRTLAPWNIHDISVTFDVFTFHFVTDLTVLLAYLCRFPSESFFCSQKIKCSPVISMSTGLSHLHFPSVTVTSYCVPPSIGPPLMLSLKSAVAVPSIYSSVLLFNNNSLNINQLNYFNQTIGTD